MPEPESPEPESPEPESREPESAPRPEQSASPSGWRRLVRAFLRPSRSQLILALCLAIVAFGLVWQVRSGTRNDYANARQEDLVQLVDGLGAEEARLNGELNDLENTKRELESGRDSAAVARSEAERRRDVLAVLAGTSPAQGPGIRITIDDPLQKVTASTLIDALQEMRDAGAEAMEFNDSVRVVASTWVANQGSGLVVDNKQVSRPIVLDVIGDPQTLEEAVRFRGGLASQVTGDKVGASITVDRSDKIRVDSVVTAPQPSFARPTR
ncbi:DUF881 domain-containing protein [Granulicoccus phenolivorans]|uniref:DUF881 domain-containing protein n=1 Tax=Granulicoccus phenolivorans TaxID=266854 RepID=UPI00040DD5ED|nr:DUF881 domain-containing protein [Granulicoccus phenolivorans]